MNFLSLACTIVFILKVSKKHISNVKLPPNWGGYIHRDQFLRNLSLKISAKPERVL